MKEIIAIDPGSTESAYAWLAAVDGRWEMQCARKLNNAELRDLLRADAWSSECEVVIEEIASYGMAVGATVFDTARWAGRFQEAWESRIGRRPSQLVPRRTVKMHMCGSMRAKDTNIRQAVLDRYGGKAVAIGTAKAKGVFYGVRADSWQALALAITWSEMTKPKCEHKSCSYEVGGRWTCEY